METGITELFTMGRSCDSQTHRKLQLVSIKNIEGLQSTTMFMCDSQE